MSKKSLVDGKMNQKKPLHEIGGDAVISVADDQAKKIKIEGKTSNEVEIFNYESIIAATNNFSSTNKLGEGDLVLLTR